MTALKIYQAYIKALFEPIHGRGESEAISKIVLKNWEGWAGLIWSFVKMSR